MVADFPHVEDEDYYQDKENKANSNNFIPKRNNSRKLSDSNCLREITAKCLKSSTNKNTHKNTDVFGFSRLSASSPF
jgi:hypothetical protein